MGDLSHQKLGFEQETCGLIVGSHENGRVLVGKHWANAWIFFDGYIIIDNQDPSSQNR